MTSLGWFSNAIVQNLEHVPLHLSNLKISPALASLLDEIHTAQDVKIMLAEATHSPSRYQKPSALHQQHSRSTYTHSKTSQRSCLLCEQAGRPDNHFLSTCTYPPDRDCKYMVRAHQVLGISNESEDETQHSADLIHVEDPSSAVRIQVRQSPYLDTFYGHNHARLTIDSSATGNMIWASIAQGMHAIIKKTGQSAHQADGLSPLKLTGETEMVFMRDQHKFVFAGLVVESLDVDILAGTPLYEAK